LRFYTTTRILNRPAQASETESLEEGTPPAVRLTGSQLGAGTLHPKAGEPIDHEAIDLDKLEGGIPGAEVGTPSPEHGIEIRNHGSHILVTASTGRQLPDPSPDPGHRPP
jgi:hypothetical protein